MSDPRTGLRICVRRIAAFVFLFAGCPGSAFAQHLGQGMEDGTPLWRVIAALLACVAVAIIAALVMKRRMGGGAALFRARGSQRLQIVECLRVGSQVSLCIVACDGEELLMSVSQQGAALLRPISTAASQVTGRP
jgi:flagellar biogenesis protein FliO